GVVGLLAEREGRVALGRERAVPVEGHAPRPAEDAEVEAEDPARVAAGEEQDEERGDRREDERDPEEGEDDEVRDQQRPLHEPEPARVRRVEAAFEADRMVEHARILARQLPHGKAGEVRRYVAGPVSTRRSNATGTSRHALHNPW